MYRGSLVEDPYCASLPDFPLRPPTLMGDEEEVNAIHQLDSYPRAPSLHEATITDQQIAHIYRSTDKHKNSAIDNVFVRLANIFHNIHENYRKGLITSSPLCRLDRIHLQILSKFITLLTLGSIPFRKTNTGVLEYMRELTLTKQLHPTPLIVLRFRPMKYSPTAMMKRTPPYVQRTA